MWPSNKKNRAARWFQAQLTLNRTVRLQDLTVIYIFVLFSPKKSKWNSSHVSLMSSHAWHIIHTICDNHLEQKCVNHGDRMADLSVSDHYACKFKKRKKIINELENEDKKLGKKEDFITLFYTDFTTCWAPMRQCFNDACLSEFLPSPPTLFFIITILSGAMFSLCGSSCGSFEPVKLQENW